MGNVVMEGRLVLGPQSGLNASEKKTVKVPEGKARAEWRGLR